MTAETFAWFVAGATASGHLAASAPPGLQSRDAHGTRGSSVRRYGVGVRKE